MLQDRLSAVAPVRERVPPSRQDLQAQLDDLLRGCSPAMERAKQLLLKVTASPVSTVLLTGESGTGKDIAAHVLHQLSSRAGGPFVNITCSALPEPLLESELFGHERGAFTDAHQRKRGLLEEASGGSVFLDEIGEMTTCLQAKLLRFLEERTFRRVGGVADVRADVRVIAATHRNLRQQVAEGAFREDLYYRLAVLHVHLPPLRERAGDVGLLASHFADSFARLYHKAVSGISSSALAVLEAHPWQGNVRELKNVVERAVLLTDHDEIRAEDLDLSMATSESCDFRLPSCGLNLDALERNLVLQALERASGNKTRAAVLLGLTRDQIRYRIDKFGIAKASIP